jgi:hypothetical protein
MFGRRSLMPTSQISSRGRANRGRALDLRRFRYSPSIEALEDRLVLNYSFAAAPYQPINLVNGAPGVFTVIYHADDAAAPVDLGANQFNFYGTTYSGASSLFASSNGLITFGAGNAAFANGNIAFTPDQPAIAPLWTDWLKFTGGPMLMGELDAANNRLILQWDQIFHFLGNGPATFQVVLQLNTGATPGAITVNYMSIDTGDQYANGATSTVGIKDAGNPAPNFVLVSLDHTNPLVLSNQGIQFTWDNPVPVISAFSSGPPIEGGGPLSLTVTGSNFVNGSVVQVNGTPISTTFVSATQLQATLPSSDLAEEGTLSVAVLNPGSAGQESNTMGLGVADAPLAATSQNIVATEGQALANVPVARFTDAGSDGSTADYSAVINWDDGNGQSHTSAGTIQAAPNNTFVVYASNTIPYAEEGIHAVSITINDSGGSTATIAGTVSVADAPLTAVGTTITAAENSLFNGPVASFSDANHNGSLADYVATINWGDGSAPTTGVIAAGGGGNFNVSGSHQYGEGGTYSVSVTISDHGGAGITTSSSAVVSDSRPVVQARALDLHFLGWFVVTGTYSDASAEHHQVSINWGDGTTSIIDLGSKTHGKFVGWHRYRQSFLSHHRQGFDIVVTVTDDQGTASEAEALFVGFGHGHHHHNHDHDDDRDRDR